MPVSVIGMNNLSWFADILESGYLISPMQGSLHISSGGPNFYGQPDLVPPPHTPTSGPPPPPAPSMAMQGDFVLGTPLPNRGTPDRFCQDEYSLMFAKLSVSRFSNCNHGYGNFWSTCGWPFPTNSLITCSRDVQQELELERNWELELSKNEKERGWEGGSSNINFYTTYFQSQLFLRYVPRAVYEWIE